MMRSVWIGLVAVAALFGCEPDPLGVAVDTSTINFVSFEDPDSDFTSMDVRDVEGDIIRFDADNQEMVWMADSLAFDG